MMELQRKGVLFLTFIAVVVCDSCYYSKFSPLHSYCLPPNPECEIEEKGLTDSEKELIVRLHNEYREKVALGDEKQAGHLPKAANMMEMVWDDELAAVAQKHAEQCKIGHECHECREVDRFQVGQNIGVQREKPTPTPTEWETMIGTLYDEVSEFNKGDIKPFVYDRSYGHFTQARADLTCLTPFSIHDGLQPARVSNPQPSGYEIDILPTGLPRLFHKGFQVVWANTWRIGCGKVVFKDDVWYYTFVVCDYGPGGNYNDAELYKAGRPCSACPTGTCCGKSCQQSGIQSQYKGLCKVIDEDNFTIESY